ncbi:uncharacterized protein LOC125760359 [Rhipicephalus sanguineus]|uniref:uncharacterized protein LOC125760359 n=1 Tax=Rhipicephalus sanguineus TaxID=34632 RepID=UPI0020C3AD61|nr:uncharacterized protein LOC125760359 [Rhipicephalus sanguineus]
MVKKTVKCSGCGMGRKIEVCEDETTERADAKCKQCELEAKMEIMMAAQNELVVRISELEKAVATEREKTMAMAERLKSAEEGLAKVAMPAKVATGNKEASDSGNNGASTLTVVGAKGETGLEKTGARVTGPTFREVVLGTGVDKTTAVARASNRCSGQVRESPAEKSDHVIIAGDSNLATCAEAVKERVRGDKRVLIGKFPGHRLGSVMRQANAKLATKSNGRNLVIIAGGLNDVLSNESAELATTLAKGVDDMRAISPQVQIVVCTIPEVPVRDGNLQRAVVDANKEIWQMSRDKGTDVVEINREVHRWGGFRRDGIHFDRRLGHEVGWRLAGRAVAFLGGTRALRCPW